MSSQPHPTLIVMIALFSLSACGDETPEPEPRSRVGEDCAADRDCEEGLACLAGELRCVILCTVGTDECGVGIGCEPAGSVGFCPLPPRAE